MHYKSFEELYGKQTTEKHRPSLKNAKTKAKGGMKTTSAKHTMPFCPSAARAKNVGITVNCIECEKPRLLFSAKKLTEKDKSILQGFLDTIFYTYGMSFHNTCDLAMAVPPKKPDNAEDDDAEDDDVEDDDVENDDVEDDDKEIIDEKDISDENDQDKPEDSDNEDEESSEKEEDSIREIFSRVFVNDSWTCASQVEKPYYSAGIYPEVCIKCGTLDATRVAKGEYPQCSGCGGNNNVSKKRLKWKQGGKDKGKRKVG